MSAPQPQPSLLDVAADWFARRRSGLMSTQDLRELQVWLDRDPAHAAAFREVARGWEIAGAVRSDPELLAIREAARKARPKGSRTMLISAAAASLAIAVVGGWAVVASGVLADLPWLSHEETQVFRTGVGQRSTVNLPDGSVVTLDTDTLLRTRQSGRRRLVDLERGQAYFRVAKDPSRPFIVAASGRTVTATGTQFDVRIDPGQFEVTLVEGKVRVESLRGQFRPGQAADMLAGWRLTAQDDRDWRLSQVDLNKETSWLSGRLTFVDDPLGAVAAELNRYSEKKIVIRDPAIAGAPIVSVFRTGDVDGFVKLVTAYRFARVVSDTSATVELAAP